MCPARGGARRRCTPRGRATEPTETLSTSSELGIRPAFRECRTRPEVTGSASRSRCGNDQECCKTCLLESQYEESPVVGGMGGVRVGLDHDRGNDVLELMVPKPGAKLEDARLAEPFALGVRGVGESVGEEAEQVVLDVPRHRGLRDRSPGAQAEWHGRGL